MDTSKILTEQDRLKAVDHLIKNCYKQLVFGFVVRSDTHLLERANEWVSIMISDKESIDEFIRVKKNKILFEKNFNMECLKLTMESSLDGKGRIFPISDSGYDTWSLLHEGANLSEEEIIRRAKYEAARNLESDD
jgi:hypothetical protein